MSNLTVLTGLWHDHSQPPSHALTLTVNIATGSLLISALATFVTFVGSRFWVIISFLIHQLRASRQDKDGLYHQHQLIYRNSSSHLSTAWLIMRIAWPWRGRLPRIFTRTLAFALPPLLCFAAFAAASVFSARVAAPVYETSRVRVQSRNCGELVWVAPGNQITSQGASVFGEWSVRTARKARSYARTCYGRPDEETSSCTVYPVRQLPYTINGDTQCPFARARCVLGPDSAFAMSTPWLDSHIHFGMNAAPEDRVKYRKVATCSVLDIRDLVRRYPGDVGSMYYYDLGPLSGATRDNATYAVSDVLQNHLVPLKI